MRWWFNALFTSVLFVVVTAIDSFQDEVLFERSLRDFPWLLPLNQRPGHDRRLTAFHSIESEELPHSGHIENVQEDIERRRRDGHALKRYTCRFKFCRIFDA
ncbi:hypothetical protein Y032_0011g1593 [Ancylostoma ceylanicum]|uniref:Uncharacterized protein n=1 Tax=Ancylostoma ceylanicum TaxID=53326 RepID=A0A016VGL8_9BILA|nr:hypothetical protein Y032_0011g1593 [Ancylostoma ceylanicum]